MSQYLHRIRLLERECGAAHRRRGRARVGGLPVRGAGGSLVCAHSAHRERRRGARRARTHRPRAQASAAAARDARERELERQCGRGLGPQCPRRDRHRRHASQQAVAARVALPTAAQLLRHAAGIIQVQVQYSHCCCSSPLIERSRGRRRCMTAS